MFDKIDTGYKKIGAWFAAGVAATTGLYTTAQILAIKNISDGSLDYVAMGQSSEWEHGIALLALASSTLAGMVTGVFTPYHLIQHSLKNRSEKKNQLNDEIKEQDKYHQYDQFNDFDKYDFLPIRSISGISSYCIDKQLTRLNDSLENFKGYFERTEDVNKLQVIDNILKSEVVLNSTIEGWLMDNYGPMVEHAGIKGVGKFHVKPYLPRGGGLAL